MGAAATPAAAATHDAQAVPSPGHGHGPRHGDNRVVGSVDHERNGFDPWTIATEFEFGEVSQENGRRVREFTLTAMDKEIEIAPGVMFPAWTYNGRVPGPTLRCVEGERLRVRLLNAGTHPHSMHFHGIHSARMDGVAGALDRRTGRRVRLRVRRPPLRLPPLSLPHAAAQTPHPQGALRHLHHRPRSRAPSRAAQSAPAAGCSARPSTPAGRNSSSS
jgi:hypothetical protein